MGYEIFISHTHSDAKLAKSMENAIHSLFGERVRVNYSSKKEEGGIKSGERWTNWIYDQVKDASIAVVLLTPASIQKPWVLWEAGAVAGASIASPNGSKNKVRPLVFHLDSPNIPDPFRDLQLLRGDSRTDAEQFLTELIGEYCSTSAEAARAGIRLAQTIEVFLREAEAALHDAPLVATEAAIEEWCLRLDNLKTANRSSEVQQLHHWLDLAFGRDADDVLRPIDLRIHRRLGEAYLASKEFKRASEQFRLCEQLAPRDIFVLRNLGQCLLNDKDFDATASVLTKIEHLDRDAFKKDAESAAFKARFFSDQNQWLQAHEILKLAFANNGKSYYLGDLLGQSLLRLRKIDDAKSTYESVLQIISNLEEKNIWSRATAANAAIIVGRTDEVLANLSGIRDLQPPPTPAQMQSIRRGLKNVSDSIAADPNQVAVWMQTLENH